MRLHVVCQGSIPELCALMIPAIEPRAEIISHALPKQQGLWPFSNAWDDLLQRIPADETIVLSDWACALALPKRAAQTRPILHTATSLPGVALRSKLGAYAAKPITVHAASQTIADALVQTGVDAKRVQVTRPLFPISPAPENELPTFMLGTACTLEPEQGLETVLQALHECRELLPQLKLVIIGDGPDKRRVLWLIEQLSLRGRVQIAATTGEYTRFLSNFDIFIACNPTDSGCNPMIGHALAHSIPVIATKLPSHEEWIKANRTGLIYERGNTTMLAQHILNLYNHPDWMAHYKKIGPQALGGR